MDSEVTRFSRLVKCEVGSLPFTHLGIPIGVNMKRAKVWKPVMDRFLAKLSKWKARYLSFAGRMTLAKSVLGSLPSYFLSLFAAPKCVINKLEKIRREFIWGKSNSRHKLRWIRWELLMKSKKAGGMGIGGIQGSNHAMLSKWWWRFKENTNQLWAEVVIAIHKGNVTSNPPTFIPLKKTIPGVWKDVGSVEVALSKIGINIKESLVAERDSWRWQSDPNGSLFVKQVCSDIEKAAEGDGNDSYVFGWNNWAPPKVNFLLWRAIIGKVASKVGLIHRGVPLSDSTCPRCGIYGEDPDHIFVNCLWAQSIWRNVLTWIRISFPVDIINPKNLISFITACPGGKVWKLLVYTIAMGTVLRIWNARNEKVFDDHFIPINIMVEKIKEDVEKIKEDVFLRISNRSNLKSPSWEKWKT
ncbi:uncharacterized protein LOC110933999 [Helianthus annuus]|uniref:uncharacterized protein LOC110933999 n=1 Tax=Helianthus annuus TaxID=4232 RepID=UPI000B9087FB|nr:uncharacterized protein LOC110933999 [Helianthus annuus]